ncbi:MAG: DUF6265 family protein [Bacteroidota bacterium]
MRIVTRFSVFASGLALLLLASCSGASLSNYSWMEGTWKGEAPDGTSYYEIWKKQSGQLLQGFSCGVIGGVDTVFKENPKIEIIENSAFYITSFPDIKGSVLYKASSSVTGQAVFINDEHPFPKKIVYRLNGDSLLVRYEGLRQGKPSFEELYFRRQK